MALEVFYIFTTLKIKMIFKFVAQPIEENSITPDIDLRGQRLYARAKDAFLFALHFKVNKLAP